LPKSRRITESNQKEELLYRLNASIDEAFIDVRNASGKPVKYGGWEGKALIADDFNAPIDLVRIFNSQ